MRSAIAAAIAGVDRGVALFEVRTQRAQLDQLLTTARALAKLATCCGALAAVLAAVGLHGLLAYLVTQQRREIGIRLALGARPGEVQWTVLRRGLELTLAGILIGAPLALAASRGIASLLYGVSAHDPVTLALVVALLAGVALLACWLPARWAARTDPMIALRAE
jgi:ABC-type antimicrobial peptide transport system permease subunit